MLNIILTFVASILFILGIISLLTPIPGAMIFLASSVTILTCSSPTARRCIRDVRKKLNGVDKFFLFLEKKVGTKFKFIGETLAKTRPGVTEDVT